MIVAVIGKGGVGKTTISALVLRRLLELRQVPVLAVDADPSNCLGPALGLTVERTLADLRDGMRDAPDRPATMSHAEWLALRAEEALVERTGFDLLTMGHPEGPGCYCFVNTVIRAYLDRLTRSYRHVLLDCEAGLEHLSRRTSGRPDVLVAVVGRGRMSAETVQRALGLYRALNAHLPPRVALVLNGFEEGEPAAAQATAAASGGCDVFTEVLAVPWDAQIAEADGAGRSLLELDGASSAVRALASWEIAR
jgi:CO dehydrogenase maturation factor